MRSIAYLAWAGVSLAALCSPAWAQEVAADGASDANEIIVSARRRDESLQDVPLTVQAVSAEEINRLNLRNFNDIAAVVPGLVLQPGNRTTGQVTSLRGLNVDVNSSGSATSVQFYLNDSVIPAGGIMQAMYDIGQIEVLRGPQGTLRGLASPSGSITVTTKRPDMTAFGGYAQGTANTIGGVNLNGAINVPIIKDVLAVRLGGLIEDNESNRVHSVTNPNLDPFSKTRAIRASVRLTPLDGLELNGSYHRITRRFNTFDQVESATIAAPTLTVVGAPANNTPIRARDRLAVENVPNVGRQLFEIFNWQGQWSFAGQRLTYVGSSVRQNHKSTEPYDKGDYFGATVPGDASLPNNNGTYTSGASTLNAQNAAQATHTYVDQTTHELRLQSDERIFGMFDYVIGLFQTRQVPWTDLVRINSVNPVTGVVSAGAPTQRRGRTLERAAFANLTVHLGEQTEISGGIRRINYKTSTNNSSAALPFGPSDTFKKTIWTASAKHRFNDDLMVYVNAGTSFRVGSGTNGLIIGSSGITPAQIVDPYLQFLYANTPETSRSYEAGLRSSWLDRRLTFNVSVFHQKFSNYIYPVSPFYFLRNPTGANPVPIVNANVARTISTVAVPVPAKVDGVEAEFGFRPTDRFSLNASVAYAKAKITNGTVPCTFTTPPAAAAISDGTTQVAKCSVSQSAGRIAPFSASVQSEYHQPIAEGYDGFVRGLLTYYGNSQNDAANPYDAVKAYGIFSAYAGVRDPDGAWEITAYAKNLFNTYRTLTRDVSPQVVNGSTRSNYRLVTSTEPREFGITARVAFGSR